MGGDIVEEFLINVIGKNNRDRGVWYAILLLFPLGCKVIGLFP
jgi:hypothetical protein